ncbi:MAG: hypothetical protein L6R38_000540 [Xanthoria sp. 2 TBL-2021]|nr:MAG: hypothetical protein L6R38_000540 [Xanthoria sp. 2 TBL-2021]
MFCTRTRYLGSRQSYVPAQVRSLEGRILGEVDKDAIIAHHEAIDTEGLNSMLAKMARSIQALPITERTEYDDMRDNIWVIQLAQRENTIAFYKRWQMERLNSDLGQRKRAIHFLQLSEWYNRFLQQWTNIHESEGLRFPDVSCEHTALSPCNNPHCIPCKSKEKETEVTTSGQDSQSTRKPAIMDNSDFEEDEESYSRAD